MDEQFVKYVRGALNHLYDPDYLRRNPLCVYFGIVNPYHAPITLQRILEEAISGLKPKGVNSESRQERVVYDVLVYRYLKRFSQREVADQLNISLRQLNREQHMALEVLAYRLWEKAQAGTHQSHGGELILTQELISQTQSGYPDDLSWLASPSPEKMADLPQTLTAVLQLLQPLVTRYQVEIETFLAHELPILEVHPVALRQILLNLFTAAIHQTGCGKLTLTGRAENWGVTLQICGSNCPGSTPTPFSDLKASLEMADRLLRLSGGKMVMESDTPTFNVRLLFPSLDSIPILVIDDSGDSVQLLQRFFTGTRYRLVGTHNPGQALELALKTKAQVIILDIMMPQIDGWEVLASLHNHPVIGRVPVVVYSILPQEELALSLGASAFLRKPVSREDFLATLERWTPLPG
jgi:CheY-like chemotaxis protein